MIDTQLLTAALAARGIGGGAAVLIAVAIIVGMLIRQRRLPTHRGGLTARTHESLPGEPAPREPSLRSSRRVS